MPKNEFHHDVTGFLIETLGQVKENVNSLNYRCIKGILLFALLVGMAAKPNAAVILSYEMEKSTVSSTIAGSTVNENISADSLTAGSALTVKDEGTGQWAWGGWTPGLSSASAAIAANEYWTWGFDVAQNVDLDLTTLDISIDRTRSGPDDFEIFVSVNGGSSSSVFTHNYNDFFGSAVDFPDIDLSGISSLQNLSNGDSVVFTLAAFNTEASSIQYLGIQNEATFAGGDGLVINGTVSPVPEPEHYAIVFAGVMMAFTFFRNKANNQPHSIQ